MLYLRRDWGMRGDLRGGVPVSVRGRDADKTRQHADDCLRLADDFSRAFLVIPDGELALKPLHPELEIKTVLCFFHD
jgi:hypothetical protein